MHVWKKYSKERAVRSTREKGREGGREGRTYVCGGSQLLGEEEEEGGVLKGARGALDEGEEVIVCLGGDLSEGGEEGGREGGRGVRGEGEREGWREGGREGCQR